MDRDDVKDMIESYGKLERDHYSFNTAQFVDWCEHADHGVSTAEANQLLATCCERIGTSEPNQMWRLDV